MGADTDDLDRALLFFDVPDDDLAALRYADEQARLDASLAAWVAGTAAELRAAMGEPSPPPSLAPRPATDPDVAAYLPVLALAAALPDTLAWSRSRGIPADVEAASMRDVGRMLRRNRQWEGEPGLGDELARWLTRHLTGAIHEIGRLQYERVRLGTWTGTQLAAAGLPVGPADLALSLHIPQTGTPLSPGPVDESFAAARRFFRRRFPDASLTHVVCDSWLLDPQLAGYLAADSNLVSFQRRFTLIPPTTDDADSSIRKFVFADTTSPSDALPQRTTLERAVVRHLQQGGAWQVRTGWLDLRRA
ncbi:acyltransferase domain-containing protein [Lapillicoccus sp.]|uniref:acyltransferase domain-containing protein n=1 Tax=Lapillicoccus sp. TaxID=1909287 RepID=UPI0032649C29